MHSLLVQPEAPFGYRPALLPKAAERIDLRMQDGNAGRHPVEFQSGPERLRREGIKEGDRVAVAPSIRLKPADEPIRIQR
jgi:hypothetical protein